LKKIESIKMKNFILFLLLMALPFRMSAIIFEDSGKEYSEKKSSAKQLKILVLGDSNGALRDGWVNQLKKIRSNDTIFSISISGNMENAYASLGNIDKIIIMLGTNDCKAVFKDSLSVVPENMRKVIAGIRYNAKLHKDRPTIFIVSPPPFGPDEKLEEKYKGGTERITWLNEQLIKIAQEENVEFINSFQILLPVFKYLSVDGVHLTAEGQMMIALIIKENIKYFPGR
jgi:lysophospholipase L1-like esterase